jgi:hypothetical protein
LSIEASDHDVVLQLLGMVGESAVERRAIGCDAILRFPDGTAELWTTNGTDALADLSTVGGMQ